MNVFNKIFHKISPDEKEFDFEARLQKFDDLLKEIHDKIIGGGINSQEELISSYEIKMNEAVGWFPNPENSRVKSNIDRYDFILNHFNEYKEKKGEI
jgi:hypothetical protein